MLGEVLPTCVVPVGRPGLSKPMRLLYFGAPFIFSPAHAGTEYVSTHRLLKFESMARKVRGREVATNKPPPHAARARMNRQDRVVASALMPSVMLATRLHEPPSCYRDLCGRPWCPCVADPRVSARTCCFHRAVDRPVCSVISCECVFAHLPQTMKRIGAEVADATIVTQSMWEAATDGLHYLSGSNDNWNGHISNMVTQVRGVENAACVCVFRTPNRAPAGPCHTM